MTRLESNNQNSGDNSSPEEDMMGQARQNFMKESIKRARLDVDNHQSIQGNRRQQKLIDSKSTNKDNLGVELDPLAK